MWLDIIVCVKHDGETSQRTGAGSAFAEASPEGVMFCQLPLVLIEGPTNCPYLNNINDSTAWPICWRCDVMWISRGALRAIQTVEDFKNVKTKRHTLFFPLRSVNSSAVVAVLSFWCVREGGKMEVWQVLLLVWKPAQLLLTWQRQKMSDLYRRHIF